jgi:hypothetical protein
MASQVVTKSDFALLTKVTRSRVSQWIREKKIGPEAIVGEGRGAKINVRIALEQLRVRLDPNQRFGLNGLSTKLSDPVTDEIILVNVDVADEQLRAYFNPPGAPRRSYAAIVRDGLTEQGLGGPAEMRIASETLRLLNETVIAVETDRGLLTSGHVSALIHTIYRALQGGKDDELMIGLDIPTPA